MAFLWLAAVTIWTFLILRTLAGRTVLSAGTVALYSLLGALWGPFILWLAHSFIPNPTWYGAFSLVLLWIPVGVVLLARDSWRSLTVADSFVIGFAVGFGYDATLELLGIVFRDVARDGLPKMLSFLPPTTLQGDSGGWDYAMHGYWLALPTLALVAGFRFLRSRVAAVALAILCFAFSAVERILWGGIVELGFSKNTADTVSLARQNGRLFPWIALVALLALSVLEARWVARACRSRGKVIDLMRDWQASVMAFADRDWPKFAGVNSLSRMRRENQLLRAELIHSPENPRLKKALDASERRLMQHPDPNNVPAETLSFRKVYLGLGTLALLSVGLVLLPFLPESATHWFWLSLIQLPNGFTSSTFPLPPSFSAPVLTYSAAILLALATWFYVVSAEKPPANGDANAMIRSRVESWIKALCFALFSFLFLSGIALDFSFFSNPILYALNLDYLRNFGLEQLYTYIPFLMAVALAATHLQTTLVRSPDPRKQNTALYRRAITFIAFLIGASLTWKLGLDQWLYNLLLSRAGGEWAPASARDRASWLAGIVTVGAVWGFTFAARRLIVPRLRLIRSSLLSRAS